MRLTAVLAAAVALPVLASAQEPTTFFGIAFDAPLAVPECEWREQNAMRFSRKDPVVKERVYTLSPKDSPCYERAKADIGSAKPLANEGVFIKFPILKQPDMCQGYGLGARIVDGRVQRLSCTTNGLHAQERDMARLTEKLGKPKESTVVPSQNRMGATFDGLAAAWNLPGGGTVTYFGLTSSIKQGELVIGTAAGLAAHDAVMKELERKFSGTEL